MLTDDDYQCLEWFERNGGHIPRTEADLAEKERIRKLIDLGYIEYFFARGSGEQAFMRSYWLTLAAVDALSERKKLHQQLQKIQAEAARKEQEAAVQQMDDRRRAKRHEYFVSGGRAVFRILNTVFVEHFHDVIAHVKEGLKILSGK